MESRTQDQSPEIDKDYELAKNIVNELIERGWANPLDFKLALTNILSRKISEQKNQAAIQEREHCIVSLIQFRHTADRSRAEALDRKEMGIDWLNGFWTGADTAVKMIEKRRHTRPEEIEGKGNEE